MDQKEFDLMMSKVREGIKGAVQTEVEQAVAGLVTTDQLVQKLEAVKIDAKTIEELTTAVEKQGLDLKRLFKGEDSKKSLRDVLEDNLETLQDVASGKSRYGKINVKANVLRANVVDSTIALRLTDVGQVATQLNVLAPLFRSGVVGAGQGGVVRYIDQDPANITRSANWTAEGAQKPESAIKWVEKTLPIETIADTIPVSMQALQDIDFIEGELRRLLDVNIAIKEDNSLWDGNGTPPNIKGIYSYADTFTAAASGITDANIFDLIVKAQENVMAGKRSKYMPNYAVMNIVDVNKMRLHKDKNGAYIVPPFAAQDGSQVGGIQIVTSNSVTANTMLVGDFNWATLYTMGDITFDFGWIDKQFVENMMTLRAEKREALLVRSVDTGAFNKITDIGAALTTLAT